MGDAQHGMTYLLLSSLSLPWFCCSRWLLSLHPAQAQFIASRRFPSNQPIIIRRTWHTLLLKLWLVIHLVYHQCTRFTRLSRHRSNVCHLCVTYVPYFVNLDNNTFQLKTLLFFVHLRSQQKRTEKVISIYQIYSVAFLTLLFWE